MKRMRMPLISGTWVDAKKGDGDEYHAGKIMKYLGFYEEQRLNGLFDEYNKYLVQFEDGTKENVNGHHYGGRIKVGSQ